VRQPEAYDIARYLEAKAEVDDRALNPGVREHLLARVRASGGPLRVLEWGAGTGTMFRRVADWGLGRDLDYTMIEADPGLASKSVESIRFWAQTRGLLANSNGDRVLRLGDDGEKHLVRTINADALAFAGRGFDLLLAHCFLDLVNLDKALERMEAITARGGLWYLTHVFEGSTVFRPEAGGAMDERIECRYHASMDPDGGRRSRVGRRLLTALDERGHKLIAAGASDWVVTPPYCGDEEYFLHHILRFVEQTLAKDPEFSALELAHWLTLRHAQVAAGRLVFMAGYLDALVAPRL